MRTLLLPSAALPPSQPIQPLCPASPGPPLAPPAAPHLEHERRIVQRCACLGIQQCDGAICCASLALQVHISAALGGALHAGRRAARRRAGVS